MRKLRDRLPPLNSLVVFEAVARHLSFTAAADELSVTQAAVSRQVRLLEDFTGVTLFYRLHRAIELTPHGKEFQTAIAIGLEHIAHVTDDIRIEADGADITISSSVTFASYWLMARVAKYRAEFPNIDVRLVASAKTRDLGSTGIDFAVRYGKGTWDNVIADHMFGNDIFPVCSPAYLDECGGLNNLSDLKNATLLKLSQSDRNWVRWSSWFKHFGISYPIDKRGHYFDHYMLLLHAAIRGEGVALCGARLAEDLIRRGELVKPVDAALKSEFSFFLLRSAHQPGRPHVENFRKWLLSEAAGEESAESG
jgi:LysR family transcriptional regulator, glycine cleavage system transcriptional activator